MGFDIDFTVSVPFDDMLAELPDDVLRRELELRRDDENRRVAATEAKEASLEVSIDQDEVIQSLDEDTLDQIADGRPRKDEDAADAARESLTDTIKDIDRAVKTGDMAYYRILMNRLAPNAVIL